MVSEFLQDKGKIYLRTELENSGRSHSISIIAMTLKQDYFTECELSTNTPPSPNAHILMKYY